MAGKKLEAFREWFTPRRRLWAGIWMFAIAIAVPIVSPGTTAAWLIGPAALFFLGSFIPNTNGRRKGAGGWRDSLIWGITGDRH